jgi:hypothetical protein
MSMLNAKAAGVALSTKDEASDANAGLVQGNRENGRDFLARCAAEQGARRDSIDKAIATARARAALLGITMHVLAGGDGRHVFFGRAYNRTQLLARWNLTCELRDLTEVSAWLDRARVPL